MLHRVESPAITDPLTGLFSRRRFADVLKREFAVTKRCGSTLGCLMTDLDHLKQGNDAFGREAGNQVLEEAARIIAGNGGEVDVPTRQAARSSLSCSHPST